MLWTRLARPFILARLCGLARPLAPAHPFGFAHPFSIVHPFNPSASNLAASTVRSIPSSAFLSGFLGTHPSMSEGPVYSSIQTKLTEALEPTTLEIVNESHLHAHHAAMKGVSSTETHFRVSVISDKFEGKSLMQRHRMIYSLLEAELQSGLHALSLTTKTPAEIAAASASS